MVFFLVLATAGLWLRRVRGRVLSDPDGGVNVSNTSQPTSRDLALLAPEVRSRVEGVLADLRAAGHSPYVYETARSAARGAELAAAGFSQRGSASKHVPDATGYAHAADIVDGRRGPDGRPVLWGASVSGTSAAHAATRTTMATEFFAALGQSAERRGLTWGGNWRSLHDPAHVEG